MTDQGTHARPTASKFSNTLIDILDRVEYRRVPLEDTSHPIFRLRYDAYRREAFIPENAYETTTDDLDRTPNVMCFGVYIDGELVSSVRLNHLTADARYSVSMRPFGDVLNPLLDQGMHFIDPSRFTTERDATLAYPALPYLTLRIAAMACEHFKPDYCLSAVRPEHAAFYKRVFRAKPWAEPRAVGGDIQFKVCLYAAKYHDIREAVYNRFPFFLSTRLERTALFSGGNSATLPVKASARRAAQAWTKREEPDQATQLV